MFGKNVKKNFLKKVKDMNKEYIRKMTLESILNDSFFENEIDDYSYEDYGLLKEKFKKLLKELSVLKDERDYEIINTKELIKKVEKMSI
jgi:hypothetical protein